MNNAHIHLMVNHFPMLFPVAGILLFMAGDLLKSDITKRMAYFIFICGALLTIPAFISGEGAEEVLEQIPGVTEQSMHNHEEFAEKFALLSYLLGAASLLAAWLNYKKHHLSKLTSYGIILLAIAVLMLAKFTGTSGGEIRHSEIRSGQPNNGKDLPANADQNEEDSENH